MVKLKKENLIEGWKIILKYLRPHREAVFALIGLSVVSAALNAGVPYLAGRVIDSIISQNSAVFIFVAIWFFVRISGNIIDWRISIRNDALASDLDGEYIAVGYAKLLRLPLSFHKNHKMGDILNRIARAADQLYDLVHQIVIGMAPQLLSIVFALYFVFSANSLLALVLICSAIIYISILIKTAPALAAKSKVSNRAFYRVYGDAHDTILNVASVKQATAENDAAKKLFHGFVHRAYGLWFELTKFWSVLNFWQALLVAAAQFLIYLIAIFLIRDGKLTIGELVMFGGYSAMFLGPFAFMGRNWQTIQNGITAIQYAEKILNIPAEEYSPKNTVILEKVIGEVEFNNISFWYSKKQGEVLKNINLRALPGEKVALVGESGVGKSTLVDLISHYYKPAAGKILIDGHNVKNLDLKFLRSQIAVVPQEIMLFNDTIKNNIKYGSFSASNEKIAHATGLAHADEFINNFPRKYEQIVGERGIKLSMGQKQRVALARAFLRDPKILILDEPTSALDAKSEKFIQESLRELMHGRTTFIIAHRLSTVRDVDKIFVLHKGTIAEVGTHDELIAKKDGVYRRLYELQVGFN
ncbi:hypothetical protein A2926_04530 [Candidatus Giovannonibacteria bacterium RIFCSPLOWO2_01_FULL_44_40]|uniref:ABC transporter ATP-binding protein n=1 Tax=Candidatus Giovannonibacteria bacterium RIFCSPHIGHO2_01_FULL_45_23 TaxID=1798325 RepID=A0A1F5VHT8_9BACT|nr:MAG: hypothetical protein A2834_02975 [Candidatus Giovannonibacteria bacterium RIFCSPHIGHO2_01_FULL_45_23]OGF75595.1 MAG: hypothetical protein A3C77_00835 [Candidatus Giovannonibacteria bacterium RIFCSPHIGHO2_02_FULL_45_13]OGF80102.1 MAG: hypothetical protein A2926_04530 [Candidatus Giovannonibacteria bacterium RIFCSPLOWO2_01_FULL_44_40]